MFKNCGLGIGQAGHRDTCVPKSCLWVCVHSDSGSMRVNHVDVCGFLKNPAAGVGNGFVSPGFSVSAWEAVTYCFHLFMPLCVHLESIHGESSVGRALCQTLRLGDRLSSQKEWDGRFHFSKVEPGWAGEKGVVTGVGDFGPSFGELLSSLPEWKPGLTHNFIHPELSHKSRRNQKEQRGVRISSRKSVCKNLPVLLLGAPVHSQRLFTLTLHTVLTILGT